MSVDNQSRPEELAPPPSGPAAAESTPVDSVPTTPEPPAPAEPTPESSLPSPPAPPESTPPGPEAAPEISANDEPVSDAGRVQETADAAPAESPQAASVATDPATAEPADSQPMVADTAPAAETHRKVQLNPTQAPGVGKAVPSLAATDPTAHAVAEKASAEAAIPHGEVEIPKSESIDEDLAAQLDAALSGSSTASTTTPVATPKDDADLDAGQRLKGRVESIDDENLILEIGYRLSGVLNRRHFEGKELPAIGDELDTVVESVQRDEGLVQLGLLKSAHRSGGDWNALAVGQVVECTVQKTNKGGLEIHVGPLRGFMPAGQVELSYVGDLEPYVGQKLTAKVIDVNPKKRNLVVSRRALLQEQRDADAQEAWKTLSVGDQRTGRVKTVKDYGAFVDIGGVDGLLHVRELSWTRVNHPSDVVSEGQEIQVKILSIDAENKKISLGMKQLVTNPWDYAETRYPKNTVVTGTVKKTTDFGAFVEIEPGLEGLIHISELDYKRVNRVQDVVTEGEEVEAQVLDINKNKRRISLSIKAIKPKPQPSAEEVAARAAADEEEKKRRTEAAERRKTLKGGIGGDKGGGLFGNPNDF